MIDGCSRLTIGQGRCGRHYQQYLNSGGHRLDQVDRVFTRIEVSEDGCWIWQGSKDKHGYGRTNLGSGKIQNTHRFLYEQLVGAVGTGLELDHLCMNQSCVNPSHLEPVTHQENIKRWARNLGITHCPQGHEYSDENTYVSPIGRRICRQCTRASGKRYRERLKNDIRPE